MKGTRFVVAILADVSRERRFFLKNIYIYIYIYIQVVGCHVTHLLVGASTCVLRLALFLFKKKNHNLRGALTRL
jgi:hypothetical protein